jgi:hypothetical protein
VHLSLQGFAVKKADVRELLRRHGEEESATIGLETFQRVMTDKLSERTQQDDMRRAFQVRHGPHPAAVVGEYQVLVLEATGVATPTSALATGRSAQLKALNNQCSQGTLAADFRSRLGGWHVGCAWYLSFPQ